MKTRSLRFALLMTLGLGVCPSWGSDPALFLVDDGGGISIPLNLEGMIRDAEVIGMLHDAVNVRWTCTTSEGMYTHDLEQEVPLEVSKQNLRSFLTNAFRAFSTDLRDGEALSTNVVLSDPTDRFRDLLDGLDEDKQVDFLKHVVASGYEEARAMLGDEPGISREDFSECCKANLATGAIAYEVRFEGAEDRWLAILGSVGADVPTDEGGES